MLDPIRIKTRRRTRHPGQGVVEYGGALVIAAVIVAMAITILPPNLAAYLQNIQSSILQYLVSKIPV